MRVWPLDARAILYENCCGGAPGFAGCSVVRHSALTGGTRFGVGGATALTGYHRHHNQDRPHLHEVGMTQSTHLRAVVSSRHDVSPELWIIRLAPEEPVSFQAGQYVTVGVQDGQRTVERPYSVASSPR